MNDDILFKDSHRWFIWCKQLDLERFNHTVISESKEASTHTLKVFLNYKSIIIHDYWIHNHLREGFGKIFFSHYHNLWHEPYRMNHTVWFITLNCGLEVNEGLLKVILWRFNVARRRSVRNIGQKSDQSSDLVPLWWTRSLKTFFLCVCQTWFSINYWSS